MCLSYEYSCSDSEQCYLVDCFAADATYSTQTRNFQMMIRCITNKDKLIKRLNRFSLRLYRAEFTL